MWEIFSIIFSKSSFQTIKLEARSFHSLTRTLVASHVEKDNLDDDYDTNNYARNEPGMERTWLESTLSFRYVAKFSHRWKDEKAQQRCLYRINPSFFWLLLSFSFQFSSLVCQCIINRIINNQFAELEWKYTRGANFSQSSFVAWEERF